MSEHFFFPLLDQYGAPFLLAVFLLLLGLQARWPLRRWVERLWPRLLVNIGVAVPTFLVLRLLLIPASVAGAIWSEANGFGLLNLVSLPAWLHGVLAILLMDYLLYAWHWLNHRVDLLWRFHNVHHTDRDLGVSTAFRFHFGEMLLGAVVRVAGVVLIGVAPLVVLVYEIIFEASVAFHHSNWRLPYGLERRLSRVFVTPRMHGIHHSNVEREANSNYSNLLNIWDRLHRTIRLNVPQDEITIGVAGYQDDGPDHTVKGLLTLPFRRQKTYWRLSDGTRPDRTREGPPDRLVE